MTFQIIAYLGLVFVMSIAIIDPTQAPRFISSSNGSTVGLPCRASTLLSSSDTHPVPKLSNGIVIGLSFGESNPYLPIFL